MTHIDFYILSQEAAVVRQHYSCRLAEKAINHGHKVVIAVDNQEQAITLSDYLWAFKPESFLPHQRQDQRKENGNDAPIAILWDANYDNCDDILINLKQQVPESFSQFKRVIEIVIQEKECLESTRAHFQFYRDRGYPLKSHKIEAN